MNEIATVFWDPRCSRHTVPRAFPEKPERLSMSVPRIAEGWPMVDLSVASAGKACQATSMRGQARKLASLIHDVGYLERLEAAVSAGDRNIDTEDNPLSSGTADAAWAAVEVALAAGDQVMSGAGRRAFALARPPGHHCERDRAMGFCLLANVAIAAQHLIDHHGLDRVAVIDWDVHHGNGTQDAFWTDEQVAFVSIHRWPFYPGTGDENETGSGPGLGTVRNLPVEFGTPRKDYLKRFTAELDDFAGRFRPQLVLVSAGFDSHRDDPVGSLGLETEDFEPLTDAVLDVAGTYAAGRLVSVLEGGYNAGVLAGCVETHLRRLLARSAQA